MLLRWRRCPAGGSARAHVPPRADGTQLRVPHRPAAASVQAPVARAFQIGPFTFPTKRAAQQRAQQILRERPIGSIIAPGDPDYEFVWHMLLRHPRAAEKIGCGVSHFSTRRTQMPGAHFASTHFMLHRSDAQGSETDFSYRKALDIQFMDTREPQQGQQPMPDRQQLEQRQLEGKQQQQPHEQQLQEPRWGQQRSPGEARLPDEYVLRALRAAVVPQLAAFEARALSSRGAPPRCPVDDVALGACCDVDHEAPATFGVLVKRWLEEQGLELADVALCHADNTVSGTMACDEQRSSWLRFHEAHAKLRLLSPRANHSLSHEAKLARREAHQARRRRRRPPSQQ